MAMKEWVRQLQPVQVYVILVLTVLFFIAELILSHITHALTLLSDSYQTLCNILALTGCLMTLKHGKNLKEESRPSTTSNDSECIAEELTISLDNQKSLTAATQEKKLKNTFGWARIDVMTMLICCVFLASLLFSLLLEAIQTLVHIDHNDEMHQPILVLATGCFGLILNGICYILIGGFTFHQGSFLHVTESGDVVLDKVVTDDSIRKGERRLSRTRTVPTPQYRQRQGCWEIVRDCIGCVFVVICALLVYFTDKDVAKFIDPVLSMVSATILLILSYPYMKESGLILLQTIPGSINITNLKKELLEHFPDIVNVHDLHVWQLTASKVISTVHITFQNPKMYTKIINEIKQFFTDYGITQVTIQPEFGSKIPDKSSCLMQCESEGCRPCVCCPDIVEIKNRINKSKSQSKEKIFENENVSLRSIKITGSDFQSLESLDNKREVSNDHGVSPEAKMIVDKCVEQKEEDKTTEDPLPLIANIASDVARIEESSLIANQ
ncbi:hypothetical protein Trydic_g12450 [Trypoxylus dichotomus]